MAVRATRRNFLAGFTLIGGSLAIGLANAQRGKSSEQPGRQGTGPQPTVPKDFQSFVEFKPDGRIVIINPQTEMGQGVHTSMPMILADELDIDFDLVEIKFAGNAKTFAGWRGQQVTAASRSTRFWYPEFRKMGAIGRGMFIAAAAKMWGVPALNLDTNAGFVINPGSGRRAAYSALLPNLKSIRQDFEPRPVPTDRYRYIGKNIKRRDMREKVDGSAKFGADLRFPDMGFTAVSMSPYFETSSVQFDKKAALNMPGVIDVRELEEAVAVTAETWWQAKIALEAANSYFIPTDQALFDGASLIERFVSGHDSSSAVEAANEGDISEGLTVGTSSEASYSFPFLAHACMEPLCGTAKRNSDGTLEVFAPTQSQQICAQQVAEATGMPPKKVKIIPTYIGGGFGRKISDNRAAVQAAQLAIALKRPIQVQWSREDDVKRDRYRPAVSINIKGTVKDNRIAGMQISVAGPSLAKSAGMPMRDGVDIHAVAALAEIPYHTNSFKVTTNEISTPVPLAFWRAVGDSHNPFARETFIDLMAKNSKTDPATFRADTLKKDPRMRRVLDTLMSESDWGKATGKRTAMGIALENALGSYTGQVAWVTLDNDGTINVDRILAVLDCGLPISKNTISAQVEGGVIFAQTAALYGEITFEQGQVREQNFNDYKMVRMAEAPAVDVIILPSDDEPGGVGEIGVPPTAPAIANAVFAACGVHMTSMPFRNYRAEIAKALS